MCAASGGRLQGPGPRQGAQQWRLRVQPRRGRAAPQPQHPLLLAGTVARNGDGVVINARLIQADSGVIVSSGQAFLNNRDLNYILSDANRGAVEKVVVERNVVPPLKPNTVFIR
jgi:hypothetical protein